MFLEILRPVFPFVERLCRPLRTDARQDYFIGVLTKSATEKQLTEHLYLQGFEPMLFAWVDDGQVASLRKKVGDFQYHVRIFNDGEVRGHYEFAPESAPIKHLRRVHREARTEDFLKFLSHYVEWRYAPQTYYDTRRSVMQDQAVPSYRS